MALATELSNLPGSCTVLPMASDKEAESPLEATAKLFDLCRDNDLPSAEAFMEVKFFFGDTGRVVVRIVINVFIVIRAYDCSVLADPFHVVTLRPVHALISFFRF